MHMSIYDFLKENGIRYNSHDLIDQAFIHSSYFNEHESYKGDNERLEFMGDAVLELWTSTKLYHLEPSLDEGEMTKLRAALVCENALATYVRHYKLNQFLLLGSGEEKSGGRDRSSIIADMFEALLGAIYLDTDVKNAFKFLDLLVGPYVTRDAYKLNDDYKTHLQELVQADTKRSISYETLKTSGPSNKPTFKVAVKIDGLVYGIGEGHSKKDAQKAAAKAALEKLVK